MAVTHAHAFICGFQFYPGTLNDYVMRTFLLYMQINLYMLLETFIVTVLYNSR